FVFHQTGFHNVSYGTALFVAFSNSCVYIFIGQVILNFTNKFTAIHFSFCSSNSNCTLQYEYQHYQEHGNQEGYYITTEVHITEEVLRYFLSLWITKVVRISQNENPNKPTHTNTRQYN